MMEASWRYKIQCFWSLTQIEDDRSGSLRLCSIYFLIHLFQFLKHYEQQNAYMLF